MSPYLRNTGATFSTGVNFASSGSTAINSSFIGDGSESQGLFSLYVQIDQFRVFHQQALSQHSQQGPKNISFTLLIEKQLSRLNMRNCRGLAGVECRYINSTLEFVTTCAS